MQKSLYALLFSSSLYVLFFIFLSICNVNIIHVLCMGYSTLFFTISYFYIFLLQVHGAGAWAVTAGRGAVKAGRCGALTWTGGPLFTQTVSRPSGRQTRGTVSECVTGTGTCTTGGSGPGTTVCLWPPRALGLCKRSRAAGARRAFRPGRWAVCWRWMALPWRMPSVNILSLSRVWSRPVSSLALRTVWYLNTPHGRLAPKPAGQVWGTECAVCLYHRCLEERSVQTSLSFSLVNLGRALVQRACTASEWGPGPPVPCLRLGPLARPSAGRAKAREYGTEPESKILRLRSWFRRSGLGTGWTDRRVRSGTSRWATRAGRWSASTGTAALSHDSKWH